MKYKVNTIQHTDLYQLNALINEFLGRLAESDEVIDIKFRTQTAGLAVCHIAVIIYRCVDISAYSKGIEEFQNKLKEERHS